MTSNWTDSALWKMLQSQVLEKVKPVGEVSLLILMQGLSIIVQWQFTSLFTAWNCLSYTTRGAFLTKSNLNMYILHHSADEVIQITSQELWDTIIKKTKGLRFTWLSISLKYNDLLFFFSSNKPNLFHASAVRLNWPKSIRNVNKFF